MNRIMDDDGLLAIVAGSIYGPWHAARIKETAKVSADDLKLIREGSICHAKFLIGTIHGMRVERDSKDFQRALKTQAEAG